MIGVEFTHNNCPLLPLSDNINDLNTFTSNHFHLEHSLYMSTQIFNVKKIDSRIKLEVHQALSTMFRDRFVKEYLPILQI